MIRALRKSCATIGVEEFFDTEVFIDGMPGSTRVAFIGKTLKTILANAHLLGAFIHDASSSNQEEAAGIGRDNVALLASLSEHVRYSGTIA